MKLKNSERSRVCIPAFYKSRENRCLELSDDAVYYVYSRSCNGADRRRKYHKRRYAHRRADKCDRLCAPDTDVSYDGVVCIRYDHDRGSVYGTYQRSLDEVPEMEDKADAVTEVTNGDIEFEHVTSVMREREAIFR